MSFRAGTPRECGWAVLTVARLRGPPENEVRRPGFEPGQMAWQAIILTRLYYRRATAPRARAGIKDVAAVYGKRPPPLTMYAIPKPANADPIPMRTICKPLRTGRPIVIRDLYHPMRNRVDELTRREATIPIHRFRKTSPPMIEGRTIKNGTRGMTEPMIAANPTRTALFRA